MGAEVTVEPSGFAGDWVGIGISIEQAEIVPGTVQPPYQLVEFRALEL